MDKVKALLASAHLTGISGMSLDILIVFALLAGLFLFGLYGGRRSLLSSLLAFFPAIFLFQNLWFIDNILFWRSSAGNIALSKLLIFAVLFLLVRFVVKSFLSAEYDYGGKNGMALSTISVGITAMVFVILYHVVPIEMFYNLSYPFDIAFASEKSALIVPIGALMLGFFGNRR